MVTTIIPTITGITTHITRTTIIIIAITTGTSAYAGSLKRKTSGWKRKAAIPVRGWPRVEAMRKVEEYKQNAKHCRALAALMTRPEDRVTLEEIAEAWEASGSALGERSTRGFCHCA